MNSKKKVGLAACLTAVAFGTHITSQDAKAADHTDPPGRIAAGDAADIGDLYAWHANDTLSMVLTFAGPVPAVAAPEGTYDADVLYTLNIDNNGDNDADAEILVRFGQDADGNWGVQASGIPGEDAPVAGAVESMLDGTGASVWAGVREDPFFFDLQGFNDTLQTGTLSFVNDRDTFAGANITSIVVDVPLSDALGGGTALSIWATTGRIQ